MKLGQAQADLSALSPEVMVGVAANAIAMVRRRVVEQGTNASGTSFQSIREYRPDYKDYKEKRGRYRGFVDFTLEGRMFSNTQVSLESDYIDKSAATYNSITIRPLSPENREKLEKNTRKWGKILALSTDEVNKLKKALIYDIKAIIQKTSI